MINGTSRLGIALLAPMLFVGCGGGGGGGPTPPDGGGGGGGGNRPPVVKIDAPEGEVMELSTVTLSAAESTDPDGDELTFNWKQVSGVETPLQNTDAAELSVTIPKVDGTEELSFAVTVNDGNGGETEQSVTLQAVEPEAIVYFVETSSSRELWLLHPAFDEPRQLMKTAGDQSIDDWKLSPDRLWLAIEIDEPDGSESLRLVSLDGLKTVDVSSALPGNGYVSDFSWSTNGGHLVFLHDGRFAGHPELFRFDVSAEDPSAGLLQLSAVLVDEDADGAPDNASDDVERFYHSPTGDLVAFTAGGDLLVSDFGGNTITPTAGVDSVSSDIQWSFDGAYIMFTGTRAGETRRELFVADPTEENSARAVSGDLGPGDLKSDAKYRKWAPNSHRLAFVGNLRELGKYELFVVDAAAEDPAATRVVASGEVADTVSNIFEWHWSPDGDGIAFRGSKFEHNAWEAFVSQFTETGIERINVTGTLVDGGRVASSTGGAIGWSPDSRYLVFFGNNLEGDDQDYVYVNRADGSGVRKTLFNHTDFACGFDRDSLRVTWSGDGQLLLTDCPAGGEFDNLLGFPVAAADPRTNRISFTGDGDHIETFASSADGSRIVVAADITPDDGIFFLELLEVTTTTAGAPRRLLPAQDPASDVFEFSLIGPAGVIDAR